MQYLIKKNRSPSYINSALRFIRAYFRCAVEADYLRSNPAEIITWQHQGKALSNTFSIEEVRALLNIFDFSTCLSARNLLVPAIAFDTGALCDIPEKDVRDNVILLHGKGSKEQHIPLAPYKGISLHGHACCQSNPLPTSVPDAFCGLQDFLTG